MSDDKPIDELTWDHGLPDVWPEGVKLLIEVDMADRMTPGGIVVPDVARENQQRQSTMGTVLRMGPHASVKFADGKECVVGCRVVFARYGGYPLKEIKNRKDGRVGRDERDLRIINDEDVLALLEDTWQ